jgi:hypothetical protein
MRPMSTIDSSLREEGQSARMVRVQGVCSGVNSWLFRVPGTYWRGAATYCRRSKWALTRRGRTAHWVRTAEIDCRCGRVVVTSTSGVLSDEAGWRSIPMSGGWKRTNSRQCGRDARPSARGGPAVRVSTLRRSLWPSFSQQLRHVAKVAGAAIDPTKRVAILALAAAALCPELGKA